MPKPLVEPRPFQFQVIGLTNVRPYASFEDIRTALTNGHLSPRHIHIVAPREMLGEMTQRTGQGSVSKTFRTPKGVVWGAVWIEN